MWISPYPEGEYSISYLNQAYTQAAAYIITQKKSVVVKYIETTEKKIENVVPTIEVNIRHDDKEKVNIGVVNCQ